MVIRSLETSRLLLREIQAHDAKALHECVSIRMLEDVYLPFELRPLPEIYVEQAIQERKRVPRRRFELAILLKDSRRVIGACTLRLNRSVLVEADLGYIIHPDYRNLGYATEAAERLVTLAFESLHVFRITAHCEAGNHPSLEVLKKIGLAAVEKNKDRLSFACVRPISLEKRPVEPIQRTRP